MTPSAYCHRASRRSTFAALCSRPTPSRPSAPTAGACRAAPAVSVVYHHQRHAAGQRGVEGCAALRVRLSQQVRAEGGAVPLARAQPRQLRLEPPQQRPPRVPLLLEQRPHLPSGLEALLSEQNLDSAELGLPEAVLRGVGGLAKEAARAIEAAKAKQTCRTRGKQHFPYCKPPGKRPRRKRRPERPAEEGQKVLRVRQGALPMVQAGAQGVLRVPEGALPVLQKGGAGPPVAHPRRRRRQHARRRRLPGAAASDLAAAAFMPAVRESLMDCVHAFSRSGLFMVSVVRNSFLNTRTTMYDYIQFKQNAIPY